MTREKTKGSKIGCKIGRSGGGCWSHRWGGGLMTDYGDARDTRRGLGST